MPSKSNEWSVDVIGGASEDHSGLGGSAAKVSILPWPDASAMVVPVPSAIFHWTTGPADGLGVGVLVGVGVTVGIPTNGQLICTGVAPGSVTPVTAVQY